MLIESQGQDLKTREVKVMMNAYFVYKTAYYQGEIIKKESWIALLDDKDATAKSKQFTNLLSQAKEIEANESENTLPFSWRRGYLFKKNNYYMTIFDYNGEHCYQLNDTDTLTIEFSYKLYSDISAEQLLKEPMEKVIAYFKDRGMTYCPLTNQ